jgi:transcriptional regulator with XRE-family HTH domain
VKKVPNPIDVHVGGRVRMRRMLIGMSQEKLGEQLGLTFQQVQKYEKGSNRISASRLYRMGEVLGVPVQFFYEELPEIKEGSAAGVTAGAGEAAIMEFLASSEGLQLNKAFSAIADGQVRRKLVELVRVLSGQPAERT